MLHNRALIRLSGDDVRGFLQGLVTQDMQGDLPVWAALLSPQGKVLFDFIIWADRVFSSQVASPDGLGTSVTAGENTVNSDNLDSVHRNLNQTESGTDILLDVEAGAAEALVKRLSLYRLRRAISISLDPAVAVHWSAKPVAGASPDPRMAELGWRWLAAPDAQSADTAWLAHRLALGVCEGAAELGDLLWLECNAAELNGVSFTKGCYVGQENTARMNWRQKVNRRLIVRPLEQSDPARQRAAYPDLALAVDHVRVEDIDPVNKPGWMC